MTQLRSLRRGLGRLADLGNIFIRQAGSHLDMRGMPAAKAIWLITGGFIAILAAEILNGAGMAVPSDPPVDYGPRPASTNTAGSVTPAISEDLIDIASRISARPLFSPDRRPAAKTVPTTTSTAAAPVKLVGTIVSPEHSIAFLEVESRRFERVVGDTVGTAHIIDIAPTRIALRYADGKIGDLPMTRGSSIAPTPRPPPTLEPSHLAFHMEE